MGLTDSEQQANNKWDSVRPTWTTDTLCQDILNDLKNYILLTESVISAFRHGCSLCFKTGRNHSSATNFLPFQRFILPPLHTCGELQEYLVILRTNNLYLWIEIELPAYNSQEKPVEQLFKRKRKSFFSYKHIFLLVNNNTSVLELMSLLEKWLNNSRK